MFRQKKSSHHNHHSDHAGHSRSAFFLGEMEERAHHRQAPEKAMPKQKPTAPEQKPTASKPQNNPAPEPKPAPILIPEPKRVSEPSAHHQTKKERRAHNFRRDLSAPDTAEKKRVNAVNAALPKESKSEPDAAESAVRAEIDGLYRKTQTKKRLKWRDVMRYALLFVSIFGFLIAGYFVAAKLLDYYRSYVAYAGLQELVGTRDRFADDYLKKSPEPVITLSPQDILNGKSAGGEQNAAPTDEQQTLLGKIGQLKKLNPDTVGWISIEGTVVNYPVVWSRTKNYYLHRDFYGASRAGGAIYVDERCDPDLTENRNTVIYGHNMSDGSMFASLHDFASSSVFYGAKIQIATENGIYLYEPFSVHQSNAYDNYFETDFASDSDFLDFCETMSFISMYEKPVTFNRNSQIITLSTCMDQTVSTDQRFAVHAILVGVVR